MNRTVLTIGSIALGAGLIAGFSLGFLWANSNAENSAKTPTVFFSGEISSINGKVLVLDNQAKNEIEIGENTKILNTSSSSMKFDDIKVGMLAYVETNSPVSAKRIKPADIKQMTVAQKATGTATSSKASISIDPSKTPAPVITLPPSVNTLPPPPPDSIKKTP